LRLLRNGTNLEDYAVEVPPMAGTLIVFRRADNSWHGHKPYEGPRRAIQFNWVTSQEVVEREQARHRFSTRLKKLTRIFARP
jgi:SM-20-related protein